MQNRNRVGFKHYDEEPQTPETTTTTPAVVSEEKKGTEKTFLMSPAHAEALENIKNLSEIICDKNFANDFNEAQRIAFVSELIKNASINAELSTLYRLNM